MLGVYTSYNSNEKTLHNFSCLIKKSGTLMVLKAEMNHLRLSINCTSADKSEIPLTKPTRHVFFGATEQISLN